jgi:hypothetical protein
MKNEAVFDFPGPQSSVSCCRKYGSLTQMGWNKNVVTSQSFCPNLDGVCQMEGAEKRGRKKGQNINKNFVFFTL